MATDLEMNVQIELFRDDDSEIECEADLWAHTSDLVGTMEFTIYWNESYGADGIASRKITLPELQFMHDQIGQAIKQLKDQMGLF